METGASDLPEPPRNRRAQNLRAQREQAKDVMAQAAAKLRSADFKVSSLVKEGDARDVILNHSEAWHADLIFVGSHGRTGLDRFQMGSVPEAVARHAHCSVEIVRTRFAR